jgi:hypothetical protein
VTNSSGEQISRQDIDAVAEKLQSWSESLSDQEQLVMGWILARAQAAENPDVSGYFSGQAGGAPFSAQLAQAAGLNPQSSAIILQDLRAHGLSFGRLGRA